MMGVAAASTDVVRILVTRVPRSILITDAVLIANRSCGRSDAALTCGVASTASTTLIYVVWKHF